MKIDSFLEIANVLKKHDNILLFPHLGVDGDAIGSSVALCIALRNLGKKCYILLEDDVPNNLIFLDKGYCTRDKNIFSKVEVAVAIDCGEEGRIPNRIEVYNGAAIRICIDHHRSKEAFGDFNHVDISACATGELIFKLIKAMNLPIDKEIGEALYAAICTDSGKFQYSNTTKETHLIAAELFDSGIDATGVSNNIFESNPVSKLKLQAKVVEKMEFLKDGKIVLAFVSREMLKEAGASMDESSGIISELRSILGVEVAALVKEENENLCKVSLRAKSYGNVAIVAEKLGGGGHLKAAGLRLEKPLAVTMELLRNELKSSLMV